MALPRHGVAPIKCAKRGCFFRGYETDLQKKADQISGVKVQISVCPDCGHDSYQFMTKRQIAIWEQSGTRPDSN